MPPKKPKMKGISRIIGWRKSRAQVIIVWILIATFFGLFFAYVGLTAGLVGWIEVAIASVAWILFATLHKQREAASMWVLLVMGAVMAITLFVV